MCNQRSRKIHLFSSSLGADAPHAGRQSARDHSKLHKEHKTTASPAPGIPRNCRRYVCVRSAEAAFPGAIRWQIIRNLVAAPLGHSSQAAAHNRTGEISPAPASRQATSRLSSSKVAPVCRATVLTISSKTSPDSRVAAARSRMRATPGREVGKLRSTPAQGSRPARASRASPAERTETPSGAVWRQFRRQQTR
jgi:hypothetical protein